MKRRRMKLTKFNKQYKKIYSYKYGGTWSLDIFSDDLDDLITSLINLKLSSVNSNRSLKTLANI